MGCERYFIFIHLTFTLAGESSRYSVCVVSGGDQASVGVSEAQEDVEFELWRWQ